MNRKRVALEWAAGVDLKPCEHSGAGSTTVLVSDGADKNKP